MKKTVTCTICNEGPPVTNEHGTHASCWRAREKSRKENAALLNGRTSNDVRRAYNFKQGNKTQL